MIDNEFKIGEECPDTDAYGTVVVKDIFVSITNPTFFCYRVEVKDNPFASFLCSEEDLFPARDIERD